MSNRLETRLGDIVLKNPVMPASGTFGFGMEMSRWYDLNVLGAISLKGTTGEERFGNPTPRIAECREGMLNAVGLQNPGVDAVVAHELPQVRAIYDGVLLANISGFSIDEYVSRPARLPQHVCPCRHPRGHQGLHPGQVPLREGGREGMQGLPPPYKGISVSLKTR